MLPTTTTPWLLINIFLLLLPLHATPPFIPINGTCHTTCGSIPIKFPFGSGFGCGHPDFGRSIKCSSGTLQFSTGTGIYTISSIDYSSNNVIVTDPFMSTCASMQNSGSFRLDRATPFNIVKKDTFVLLGCSTTSPVFDKNVGLCDTGSASHLCRGLYSCKGVTGIGLDPNAPISTCCVYDPPVALGSDYGLDLPKLQCSSYASIYGFGGDEGNPMKWEFGISLQYNDSYYSDTCKNCEASGGLCGFAGLKESFACICRNGMNTTTNCFGRGYAWSGTWKHKIQTVTSAGGFFWNSFLFTLPIIEKGFSTGLKMYLVESKGGAIACMLLALFFLGTWPALLTLLERRGRLPQHTYLDYTITNLLAAVIIAFTFGEIGKSTTEKPNFLIQLSQDNWPSVLFAMAGGVVLSLGNLSTQYAWAFVGLSVTEVITASITVVIGTTLNYFLDDKINKAEILFPGVGCFLIAVCLGSGVHASNAADNKAKLSNLTNSKVAGTGEKSIPVSKETYPYSVGKDIESGIYTSEKAKVGTAGYLLELESTRAIKVFGKSTFIGLGITFFAGVCFSLFSPAFNLATNDQWDTLKDGVPHLSVYTAFFWFSVSCFVIAIILNISFLYYPVLNLPKSSFKTYLADWNGRGWALLAGFLCGFGNGLQFMGGQAAGYAAADAVQALPLVSTFWGILLFGEYRRSSRRTYILLTSMLFMFIVAVGVLMASSGHRK